MLRASNTRSNTVNALKVFMRLASADEQQQLADRAGTSRQYLYKLANTKTNYARHAKPGLAIAIETVTGEMHRETKGRLPRVYRTDLNHDCRGCAFAQKCLGLKAVASEFDALGDES
jgi:hypothetical protein